MTSIVICQVCKKTLDALSHGSRDNDDHLAEVRWGGDAGSPPRKSPSVGHGSVHSGERLRRRVEQSPQPESEKGRQHAAQPFPHQALDGNLKHFFFR